MGVSQRREKNMRLRLVAISLLSSLVGCAPEAPSAMEHSQTDTVWMSLAWSVEPGAHPAADSFGDVSGVAQDAKGNVYVSDFQAARIWVFDSEGHFLIGFGGKGEGPGEFEAPTGPAVGPDGRLYVRDVYRVSVFGVDSASGYLTRLEETFSGPVYADWTSRRATRFDAGGAMLYPGEKWLEAGTSAPYFLPYGPDRTMGDTIWVPPQSTAPQLTAFVRTGPGGGRMLRGLNHVPFAPLPAWDITLAGTVISGDGQAYRIVETTTDGTPGATFARDVPVSPIPKALRDDSLRAVRGRIDSIPVPRDQVQGVPKEVWALDLPNVFPAYQAVYVGVDGAVWVRRWPPAAGDQTVFDVFTRAGEFRHTVVLDRAILVEPTPFLSESAVIGVTRDPLTDESIILRFDEAGG